MNKLIILIISFVLFVKANDESAYFISLDYEYNGKEDSEEISSLVSAIVDHDKETFSVLLELCQNIDIRDSFNRTLLMRATIHNEYEIIDILLKNGSKIDLQDKFGRTALMFASMNGNELISLLLIERGANPSILNVYGNNAYQIAQKTSNNSLVLSLLKNRMSFLYYKQMVFQNILKNYVHWYNDFLMINETEIMTKMRFRNKK